MKTYQDLLQVKDSDKDRMDFVQEAINDHKSSDLYATACIANDYYRRRNTTIVNYERTLNTLTGGKVVDKWSPNHKVVSGFFKRFVTQQVQFLLGNGVNWEKNVDLGKDFDTRLQDAAKKALIGAVSFGFWNLDHLEVFSVTEFVPLLDEENGSLRSGIRWWQIADNKPLRATLYEEDGYTEYIWNKKEQDGQTRLEGQIYKEKRPYILNVKESEIEGESILEGENYPTFPIVPLWANVEKQSELIGVRDGIDEYDLIKNGYANDLDNAQLYWIIKGAGGMQDTDLVQFLERLKLTGAAAPADGQEVEAVTVDIPYNARETLLDRVEKDLYRDYMALNTEALSSSSATATEIKSAYEPMNAKADEFEYQVLDFLNGIMALAGIEDNPSFTRSYIINTQEEITTVVAAGQYLTDDYITEKVLTLLGDGDKAQKIIKQIDADEIERFNDIDTDDTNAEDVKNAEEQ